MSKSNPKNIIKFNGGLGNQMFQYAFAKSLEEKTRIQSFFDMSFFSKKYSRPYELNIFELKLNEIKDISTKLKIAAIWKLRKQLKNKSFGGLNFYCEEHFEFDQNLFNTKPNTLIEGFFQSERYFENIKDKLCADFHFKKELQGKNLELAEKIDASNSISLHIRRGDYVKKKRYQNLYATCSTDYYKKGVEEICKSFPNPKLFIFSDDIEWVKENLNLPYESIYVNHNTGDDSWKDMQLMSLCKHNIIANSSFSWWGAWLNPNEQKIVIAPKKWFNDDKIIQTDVIPDQWIKIEN